jgi:hypothetical protein
MKRRYFIVGSIALVVGMLMVLWCFPRGEPRDEVALSPIGSLIHPDWGPTFMFEMTNGYRHMIDYEVLGVEVKTEASWEFIPNTENGRLDRVGPTQSIPVWVSIPKGKVIWRIVIRHRKFPEGNEARIRAAAAKAGKMSYWPPWVTVTGQVMTN